MTLEMIIVVVLVLSLLRFLLRIVLSMGRIFLITICVFSVGFLLNPDLQTPESSIRAQKATISVEALKSIVEQWI